MSQNPSPQDLKALVYARNGAELTAMLLLAGTAIFTYDYFLVFVDEMSYLLYTPFTLVKTLFLFNRFLTSLSILCCWIAWGGFVNLSALWCQNVLKTIAVIIPCLFAIWNWLITIRVHALYGLNPRLKWALSITFMAMEAATLYLSTRQAQDVADKAIAVHDLHTCIPGPIPKTFWTIWAPSICYETLLFSMAMRKLVTRKRIMDSSIRKILLRDGVLYFIAIMSTRIANVAMFASAKQGTVFVVLFFSLGFNSTSLSRLILNLRSIRKQNEFEMEPYARSIDRNIATIGGGTHNINLSRLNPHSTTSQQILSYGGVRIQREVELALDVSASPRPFAGIPGTGEAAVRENHEYRRSISTVRWSNAEVQDYPYSRTISPNTPSPTTFETPLGPIHVSPRQPHEDADKGEMGFETQLHRVSRVRFPDSQRVLEEDYRNSVIGESPHNDEHAGITM